MAACVICRSPSGAPNSLRVAACSTVSCSARRAKPSAAAPTVERKMSSVAIATLKPSPGSPSRLRHRHAARRRTSARQRMRRDHLDALGDREARRIGIDHEGRQPSRARRLAGAREHDVVVGDAAVRDPGLFAVEADMSRRRRWPSWPAPRRRSRPPAPTARRPRWPCRRAPAADISASAPSEPNSVIEPVPSPCMAKAKSARPSRNAEDFAGEAERAHVERRMQPAMRLPAPRP